MMDDDQPNGNGTFVTPTWDRAQILNWYVAGSRGLWVGFVEGLYNIPTANISDHCLNKDTTSRIFRIMDAFLTFKIGDLIHSIIDSANIVNMFTECEIETIGDDLVAFCENNDCSYE